MIGRPPLSGIYFFHGLLTARRPNGSHLPAIRGTEATVDHDSCAGRAHPAVRAGPSHSCSNDRCVGRPPGASVTAHPLVLGRGRTRGARRSTATTRVLSHAPACCRAPSALGRERDGRGPLTCLLSLSRPLCNPRVGGVSTLAALHHSVSKTPHFDPPPPRGSCPRRCPHSQHTESTR